MSLRFNGGNGAYACDGCNVIMRSGIRATKGWGRIYGWNNIRIVPQVSIPVDGGTKEFCKRSCVRQCASDRHEEPALRDACKRYLAERLATIEDEL